MIAAVVVTYSAPQSVLDSCLRALRDAGGIDRLVLVDTGGSALVAADLDDVVDLVGMENQGYGAAANLGFAQVAEADVVVLLNDDVFVQPGWLEPLVAELCDEGVGVAQPALVGTDHEVVVSLGVELDRYGAGSDVGDGDPLPDDRSACELEIFTGGAVAFASDFLRETGGFADDLFLYYEDVELALRGRELGWTYRLVPQSLAEHRRGTTTGKDADGTRYYQERNRLLVAFRFAPAATVMRAVWLSVRRLRRPPRRTHLRALGAGLAGAPRMLVKRIRS